MRPAVDDLDFAKGQPAGRRSRRSTYRAPGMDDVSRLWTDDHRRRSDDPEFEAEGVAEPLDHVQRRIRRAALDARQVAETCRRRQLAAWLRPRLVRVIRHRRPNGIRPWFMSGVQHRRLSGRCLQLRWRFAVACSQASGAGVCGRARWWSGRSPCRAIGHWPWRGRVGPRLPRRDGAAPDGHRSSGSLARASTARSPGWSPRAVGLAPRGRAAGRPAPAPRPGMRRPPGPKWSGRPGGRAGGARWNRWSRPGRRRALGRTGRGDAEASGDEPGRQACAGFGVGRGVGTGPDTGGNATGIGGRNG